MGKRQDITEVIADLKAGNERAKKLEKMIDLACDLEFGMSRKAIHDLINASKSTKSTTTAKDTTTLPENKPVELG